jgi:hypothetical protein
LTGNTVEATAALEGRPPSLGKSVFWAFVLTPVAGTLGWILLPVLRLIITGTWFLDSRPYGFFIGIAFAPIIGGIIAAPVTLLVLPILRRQLAGRDRASLFLFALAGLVSGFVSPLLFMLPRLMSFDAHQLGVPAMGAGSGLIVAILYFYLTDGTRRRVLRSAVFATLSLYVVIPIGISAWDKLQKLKEPSDLGDLNLDDFITNKRLPWQFNWPFNGVVIDPYASAPITLYHRPHDGWTPPFEATISAPPRLLEDFYVRWIARGDTFAVSAVRMEALLPNLALRTPNNLEQFHNNKLGQNEHVLKDEDVLEVTVAYVKSSGDSWFTTSVNCNSPNLEADPAFPGLSISVDNRPNDKGIGTWAACQSADLLPDGHNPQIHCFKNPFTQAFDESCTVELVLPWRLYGPDMAVIRAPRRFQSDGHLVYTTSGAGIKVGYHFPARRLGEWRRMRDLSLCLIEATVVSIPELVYPSRNAALCAEIKQAIAKRKDALVGSSAQ